MKIETIDSKGKPNGWLIPIWNALENPELRPDQVYVTAIAPHTRKGPHLHMNRRGAFSVIAGEVTIVSTAVHGRVKVKPGFPVVVIPAGIPCALYNYGNTEAIVLNMPSPSWSKEEPDDWPVENWEDPPGWESVSRF